MNKLQTSNNFPRYVGRRWAAAKLNVAIWSKVRWDLDAEGFVHGDTTNRGGGALPLQWDAWNAFERWSFCDAFERDGV